ncbi:uncharacterized protein LOC114737016 isoform X2 [Neltuma alba]|uniref:uncharacterized protein LOC114734957 isoform X2 n=1 Tax=Neltuma alba TaxID=207710 RepID=UPI0010A47B83|nr:uncharacterized protein LOC114734957 isoform X2 [Prosopis alba]XP_028780736.1 uncharacterized protein LOC114737016 isoform X2 [Prosopis alba]
MRRRTLCGGNAFTSTKPVPFTGSEVPYLVSQNEDNVAVHKASIETNHDMANVREGVSKGNLNNDMDEGSNRSSHDYLDDDDMRWNFLGRESCFSCNEVGEVLVCAERDCPISLHAKCLCTEPKFDDKGNFYCPYCWYKRAWAEAQESRKKAFLAKKDLSKFFTQNGLTSDKLAENDVEVKTRGPKDVSVMGNGSGLDYHGRPGNKSVPSHPLKTLQDLKKQGERLMAGTDQDGIVVEHTANANGPEANIYVSKRYTEENAPVHTNLDHKSSNREEFDILNNNISKTRETRFVEGQEGVKLEDIRYNNEYVYAMFDEDVKPLTAFRFGEPSDGHLPDYAFSKGMQEGNEAYVDMGRVKDREKLVQNKLNLPATDCSARGTGDSDFEPLPMKESHVKQGGQRTTYTQGVSSVKSLPLKSRTGSKNARCKNEVVANSETSGLPQRSSMQCQKLASETGKRKRLKWTVEEENMLRLHKAFLPSFTASTLVLTLQEGVLKFSMEQQSIPWKKILEFGCHVFHSKRNTSDLKDKWKHMRV